MYIYVRKTINLNNLLFFKGLKCIDIILGKEHEKTQKKSEKYSIDNL